MGASLIGFVIGLVVGASSGTALGAFAGGVFGLLVGFGVYGVLYARAHLGDAPTVERHRVMCVPFGQAADCEVVGDLGHKRWHDVKRCSLNEDPDHVECDKGCVRQLNLAGVRPGRSLPVVASTPATAR